ncbi:MAG: DUF4244 domain-containing protein [Acidobacteria bacterium]|nr:DUF4244 domain-containing protein [Acidobacteriota bacterium]
MRKRTELLLASDWTEQSQDPLPDNVIELYPRDKYLTDIFSPDDSPEAGMATAEYAVATLAAVGFAGLLVVIMKSDEVRGFLLNIIRTALSLP